MGYLLSSIALGACLVFIQADDIGFDRYHLPKEVWVTAGAALAMFATWQRKVALDALNVALAVLLVLASLATVLAISPAIAVRSLALMWAAGALFVAARTCDDDDARQVRIAVVVGATLVALVALYETFGVIAGISGNGRAPGSTLGQRNAVAHLLVIVSPLAWTLAAKGRTRREQVILLLMSAVLAAGIVVTRSRAAWVTAPVVAVAWAVVQRKWLPLAVALGAAAVIAVVPPQLYWKSDQPYRDTASRLFETGSGSGLGRLTQYRATLRLVAASPLFGAGPGNWIAAYPTVSPPGDPSFKSDAWLHTGRLLNSDWLALASECGVPALLAALVLGVLLARRRGVVPTLLAIAGVGALDAVLQLPAAVTCAALVLGLTARRLDSSRELARGAKAAVALGLAAASVLAVMRVVGMLYRLQGGFDGPEQAVRWNGADLQARTTLAEAYLIEDGDCRRALPHVAALARMLPHHPVVKSQASACGL